MTGQPTPTGGITHNRLLVRRQGERLYFDVFMPEGAAGFTAMRAVAGVMKGGMQFASRRPWQDGTAGHVALRWDRPGNVFLMQRVDLLETFERDHAPLGLGHPGGQFWQAGEFWVGGTRLAAAAVTIPWDCRHIRGVYVDEILKSRRTDIPYTVDIHLNYVNAR